MSLVDLVAGPRRATLSLQKDLFFRADPRTKLLMIVVSNAAVLGHLSVWSTVAAGCAAVVLLADSLRDRKWWIFAALFLSLTAIYFFLPLLWPGPVGIGLAISALWFAKFSTVFALAIWLVTSTNSGEFLAGLRALHIPGVIVLPVAVVLRFVPAILRELRAIVDAMRLRGVVPSAWSVLKSPVRTAEHVLIPLLAMTTRMADELSAAALIRGLDRSGPRTSIITLGFKGGDALLFVITALIIGLWIFDLTRLGG